MKPYISLLLKEGIKTLTEIDWEGDFSDVKSVCVNPEDIVDYLNRVRANAPLKTKDREKFSAKYPFVHAKSKALKDTDGGIDIDHFIKDITSEPSSLINTNEKILKTGKPNEFVYKTGIPAFRGIAYDIGNGEFRYINTCPGAGACVHICYALKGRYIQYPNSYDLMTRRLNLLLNNPNRYEERLYNEIKKVCEGHSALEGYKSKVLIRWNDSGDFFSKKYINMAESVINKLQADGYNVDSYAYTKVADIAKSDRLGSTSFSSGADTRQSKQVDTSKQKMSLVVPKELFKDLNFMKVNDEKILKDRVAEFFNLDKSKVLTYDELMSTPNGDEPQWHVIVTPNDGDDAGLRRDVKSVLLTQH